MVPMVIERSEDQRMQALQRANEVRSARARTKQALTEGVIDFGHLLEDDPPDHLERMKVVELLLACPQVGEAKAHKILQAGGVSPKRRLGGLTNRQRKDLAGAWWHWRTRKGCRV